MHHSPTTIPVTIHHSTHQNQHSTHYENMILFIDLDTNENYMQLLHQIKDLGMTKANYQYVLLTLGVHELELNDFVHGGAKIIGF